MAYRRKIIDRRTRAGKALGRQLDAFQGLLFLAVLGVAAIGGLVHSLQGTGDNTDAIVAPAQAASVVSAPDGSMPPRGSLARAGTGYAPFPSDGGEPAAPPIQAMNSVRPLPATGKVDEAHPQVPWRHVTAGGVRWSLRRLSGTDLVLVVDLGGGQVANVRVAPAFEQLDQAAMNVRVDHLRSEITLRFPPGTADYVYERDGSIRAMP